MTPIGKEILISINSGNRQSDLQIINYEVLQKQDLTIKSNPSGISPTTVNESHEGFYVNKCIFHIMNLKIPSA